MGSEGSSRLVVRLAIGLVQGVALALLFLAYPLHVFPTNLPGLFAPLIVVVLFVPLLISQALGNLRRPTLIAWTIAAVVIVAGLAWYDVWHSRPSGDSFTLPVSPRALLACAVFLFVGHALVSCGDADGRIVARYPTLFDLAWKLGVQIAIIGCFVAAFWIMLRLGIALFDMIKLTGFGHLVKDPMFAIPLTTVAAAAALHATDTSAPLVRGVRTLALTMLSWLLPVIAAIALAFLISLVVTGLQPLWATRTAALLLIATAAGLVIHINAAYQDGDQHPSHILRVAGTLASVLLVFLVWIAAYALWLRVTQYGWTVDRITSAGAVAVAAMFALGYLVAAVLPGPWLKFIEHWNVYGTFFFLIVLLSLATPAADPMRLSVADQVQRLKSGMVKAEVFDFDYLRWQGGRFGRDALQELAASSDHYVRSHAGAALALTLPGTSTYVRPTVEELARHIRVYPTGKSVPGSFLTQDWMKEGENIWEYRPCLQVWSEIPDGLCSAIISDFDGDSRDDILLIQHTSKLLDDDQSWDAMLLNLRNGKWQLVAETPRYTVKCKGELESLLAGRYALAPHMPAVMDLKFGARGVPLLPLREHCEEAVAAKP